VLFNTMEIQQHSFTDKISLLEETVLNLSHLTEVQSEKIKHYESELTRMQEIMQKMKRDLYGPRTEKGWVSPEQMVFNEAEVLAKQEIPEDLENSPEEKKDRARGKRKPLPKTLEREVVVVELLEAERFDGQGNPLKVIGKEISEKLTYTPAKLMVTEYHRLKYGLDSGEVLKTATPIASILPKSMATPSLLAAIATAKYADGTPLYRLESILGRSEVHLPRCTMARWLIECAEKCMPIWNVLEERLLSDPYVACDETWTQVLKENGKTAESKSWMWVRSTPSAKEKIILFDYDPSRSAKVAEQLFQDYKGFLQVDGFASYNILEKNKSITRIGCSMHARRKFFEAHKDGATSGKSLAEVGLNFFKKLYAIEEEIREKDFDQRKIIRDQQAHPIWLKLKTWVMENKDKVPPTSKIGQAYTYFANEYDHLIGYLQSGMLEMDNGFTERAIKNFAIGRNNWLFSSTEAGANASAMFYSFVVTAKQNKVNPYKALEEIFSQIPLAEAIEDYERLADLLLSPKNISV
jgi:transposase